MHIKVEHIPENWESAAHFPFLNKFLPFVRPSCILRLSRVDFNTQMHFQWTLCMQLLGQQMRQVRIQALIEKASCRGVLVLGWSGGSKGAMALNPSVVCNYHPLGGKDDAPPVLFWPHINSISPGSILAQIKLFWSHECGKLIHRINHF